MWLVLCDASDVAALWAYRELRARGVAPLEIVSADDLVLADRWEHRVGEAGASIRIEVNGLDIVGTRLSGVLNRLYAVPTAHWRSASPADQEYVQQELTALFLSWLHALPCPVINRPTPQGLCGQWRNEAEWVCLAHRAGLPVALYRQSPHDGPTSSRARSGSHRPAPW
jgi:hypothetical protein